MNSTSANKDQRDNSGLSTSSAYPIYSPVSATTTAAAANIHEDSSSHPISRLHSESEQPASSATNHHHPSSTSTELPSTSTNRTSMELTSNTPISTNHDDTVLLAGPEEQVHPNISTAEAIIRRRSQRQSISLLQRLSQKIGLENTTTSRNDDTNTNMGVGNNSNDNHHRHPDNNHNNDDSKKDSGIQILLPHTATGQLPPSNSIRTSRYTLFNFLPRQLIAQFSKVANLYFVFISALQLVPDWSPTGRFTTLLPLATFVIIGMIHEAYDDICRHRMDKVENERKCEILRVYRTQTTIPADTAPIDHDNNETNEHNISIDMTDSGNSSSVACVWQEIRWRQLAVGDIVRIKQDDWIPADLLLLHSSLDDNICYVETAALDGETNLKEMRVPEALCSQINTPEQIAELSGMYTLTYNIVELVIN
jgi:magnesium-transporting ATPase (P-type)